MTEIAISAQELGKTYVIGHKAEQRGYSTLRDAIARQTGVFVRRVKDVVTGTPIIEGDSYEEFWALKDVNFDIQVGEIVGIIGKNGAGKSTLLKIVSRITDPSAGRLAIRGRVASLLEVGTGFHPELTGRENIFLNGTILGMTRADIKRRFDEIVAFAEVEKFLDTPVKRYSSGMYVRLAFAVAAHLEPDILVVDEVLSVGDAEFQRKCLGKMNEVAGEQGRTVLFVSHQMGMITSLCQRAMLLEHGRIVFDGEAPECVARYYARDGGTPFAVDYLKLPNTTGDQFATLQRAWIEDMNGNKIGEVDIRCGFKVKMRYALDNRAPGAAVPNFHFNNSQGQCAFVCSVRHSSDTGPGIYEATCIVPGNLLNNDTYFIDLALTFMEAGVHVSFHERSALSVVMVDPIDETLHSEARNGYSGAFPGIVRPRIQSEIRRVS